MLQPSIRAASSSSFGIVRKNCRKRKIKNAPPPKNAGMISGLRESIQPGIVKRMNVGIIVTCGGSIIVLSTSRKSALRNGKFSRANANATRAAGRSAR